MNLLEYRLFFAPESLHECCRNCDCRDVYFVTDCCSLSDGLEEQIRNFKFGWSTGTACFGTNRSGVEPEWFGINCFWFCDWKIQPASATGGPRHLCTENSLFTMVGNCGDCIWYVGEFRLNPAISTGFDITATAGIYWRLLHPVSRMAKSVYCF